MSYDLDLTLGLAIVTLSLKMLSILYLIYTRCRKLIPRGIRV